MVRSSRSFRIGSKSLRVPYGNRTRVADLELKLSDDVTSTLMHEGERKSTLHTGNEVTTSTQQSV